MYWFRKLSRLILKDKRVCFLLLVGVGVVYILLGMEAIDTIPIMNVYRKRSCDFRTAKSIVDNLCDLYLRDKHVMGTMCSEMCTHKRFKLVDCHNPTVAERNPAGVFDQHHDLSKTVLIYERKDAGEKNESRRFVFKSRKRSFLDFDYRSLDFDLDQKPVVKQLEILVNHLDSVLKRIYGSGLDRDAFQWLRLYKKNPDLVINTYKKSKNLNKHDMFHYVKLLSVNHEDFLKALEANSQTQLATFINNFAVLISQEEYLFYKYYEAKPGVLKILGTCGNFYAVEYASSLGHQVRDMKVNERKELALKFIDLFKSLDSIYVFKERLDTNVTASTGDDTEEPPPRITSQKGPDTVKYRTEPMQMCDVKLENFGLNENKQLKLIDTDMIHTNSYLFPAKVCSSHEDCHFFDCKSYCDPGKKRCLTQRINNNLQVLCEKIFKNAVSEIDGVLGGVKSSEFGANIEYELVRRLNQCSSPEFYNSTDIRSGAGSNLYRVFQILLSDSTHNLDSTTSSSSSSTTSNSIK